MLRADDVGGGKVKSFFLCTGGILEMMESRSGVCACGRERIIVLTCCSLKKKKRPRCSV